MSEYKRHCAIVDHLKGERHIGNKIYPGQKPYPKLLVIHIFQGRSKAEGFFLKRLGVLAGVLDLLCIWKLDKGYDIAFLEIKTDVGKLSSAQKKFVGILNWFGIKWAIASTVKQAHDQFKTWGLMSVHEAIDESDLRDFEQKKRDAFDMYRPVE